MPEMYIRIDDPTGKNAPVINQHQVWDKEKFLQSQIKQHSGDEFRVVSISDETAYRTHKGWKGYKS